MLKLKNGPDKEFWKKRYKHTWKSGNKREQTFKNLMESWGYKVIDFGFEALSNEYNPNSPEEKGKPDFYIQKDGHKVYFEITGTDSKNVTNNDIVWIRPDKVAYVKKHEIVAFLVHILSALGLMRFIDMRYIDESKLVYPTIRGAKETYIEINPSMLIEVNEFKGLLDSELF